MAQRNIDVSEMMKLRNHSFQTAPFTKSLKVNSLRRVASGLGTPICVDDCTTTMERITYARGTREGARRKEAPLKPKQVWLTKKPASRVASDPGTRWTSLAR
ncbi:hypothetical protein HAX54_043027, partial [Datura stramonium]|nr:hypothetical protein [Datura stramonium]